jgi:hypothetical protein
VRRLRAEETPGRGPHSIAAAQNRFSRAPVAIKKKITKTIPYARSGFNMISILLRIAIHVE